MKMDGGGFACDFGGCRLMCSIYCIWDRERHHWIIEKSALVVGVRSCAVPPEL